MNPPATIDNLIRALADIHPDLRGVPRGLPFHWDAETIRRGLNFPLVTDAGPIDLLGEISGGGSYDDLLPYSVEMELFGVTCRSKPLPPVARSASPLLLFQPGNEPGGRPALFLCDLPQNGRRNLKEASPASPSDRKELDAFH